MIVESSETVTLVGAGAATIKDVKACCALSGPVVAVDGGLSHVVSAGILPDAVIGDLDSVGDFTIAPDIVYPIEEQDSTDFDKALRNVKAPLVLGAGFSGARIDHQLACFNVLARYPDRRCILVSETDVVFLCPPSMQIALVEGTRVSLFPMGLVEGISDGLKWPLAGLNFTPDGQIGTSNEATGPINMSMTAPKMLVILPRSELENVVSVLLTAPATWPAL